MNWKTKIIFLLIIFSYHYKAIAQDPPSGYTNNYRLRMWDEGAYPTADSINHNLIDIDSAIKIRDSRIDSLKSAFTWMLNFPSGTWKRFNSDEFDNDTLKVKSGVFPKLSTTNIFTNTNTFQGGDIRFSQDLGTSLNFYYDNDLGGIFLKKNGSTSLMEFDENDGMYWQFHYPVTVTGDVDITGTYKINGTPIAGSAIDTNHYYSIYRLDTANIFYRRDTTKLGYLAKSQTWTGSNTFSGLTYTGTIETGNTTVTGDLTVSTGSSDLQDLSVTYLKQGADATYVATKVVRGKITSVGGYLLMAHGLLDYKKIIGMQFTLLRDTTGTTDRVFHLGYNASTPMAVGNILTADTTNVRYYVSPTSTALIDDSVRVLITFQQ